MTIKIKVLDSFEELDVWLKDLKRGVLPTAFKRSLLRTGKTLQKDANEAVRKIVALNAKDIQANWFRLTKKLNGREIKKLSVVLMIKDKPVSLIKLVVGRKRPRNQKKIKRKNYDKRKPVIVQINTTKQIKIKSGFIAKGSGGKYHVFRRKGKSKGPIVKQSAPSIHIYFLRGNMMVNLEKSIGKKFQKQFLNQLKYAIEQSNKPRGKFK